MENEILDLVPRGQLYACLSFLNNKEDTAITTTGIRVGGVFDTYDSACAHAKKIQERDDKHHVFVGEVGKWLPYDPETGSEIAGDSEYANEQLNKIMKGHKDNMEKARVFHELRKTEKMSDNINSNIDSKSKLKEEITEKLSKVKSMDEAKTLTTSLENIEDQIKEMNNKLKECQENDSNLKKELSNLGVSNPTQQSENLDV